MLEGHKTGEVQPGMFIAGGKFALIRRIGEGGMGEVFEAEDTFIGRRVALKVLYPQFAENPAVLLRFRREAMAAATIVHPHIVSVYEVGQRSNGAFFYIVQELLVGKNLREHLQQRTRLDVASALDVLTPIMVALVVTHDKGIIHRDIKPENIFLAMSPDGVVVPKLIDFGISKMDTGTRPLTQPGVLLGTPLYMSPEVLSGDAATVQADVWSLGVVLFEMLVGRPPFDGKTFMDILEAIRGAAAPRADSLAPGVPRGLADIVQKALEPDVDRRFSSTRDLLRAVLDHAEQHDPALVARYASIVAKVGLKSKPPPRPDAEVVDITIEPYDRDTVALADVLGQDTLDLPAQPSLRRPVWPIARVEMPWYRHRPVAPELDQCVDAAQRSLRDNALHDAIDGAEQAIVRHGASGEMRGEMRLVQAIAYRWLGDFAAAERCAAEAMQLLARGSKGWFAAVVHHGMANGCLGRNDEVETLAKDVLSLDLHEWNGHHVAALCYLTSSLFRGSGQELAQTAFRRTRAMIMQRRDVEPAVRAAFELAKAEFALHDGDPTAYLRRVERAIGQFIEAGDTRSAYLQRANLGNAHMQLGMYAQAERHLQEAIHVGEPARLMFVAPARVNLGFTLARLGRLEEALAVERAALALTVQQGYRRFEAVALVYLSEILSKLGDLAGAEAEARRAIEVASISPAVGAHARGALASILLERGLLLEALDQAKQAVDMLEELDGVEEGEALIRLAHVRALHAVGRKVSAGVQLAGAQKRLHDRMERILDTEQRKSFQENVPEHKLTFEYMITDD